MSKLFYCAVVVFSVLYLLGIVFWSFVTWDLSFDILWFGSWDIATRAMYFSFGFILSLIFWKIEQL